MPLFLCQAKCNMAYSGQVPLPTGVFEEQNSHQNLQSENGEPENIPDESNMQEDAKVNMLSNGQSEVLPSGSPLNREIDNKPGNTSNDAKMEE